MKTVVMLLAMVLSATEANGQDKTPPGWLDGWREATVAIGQRVSETVKGPDGKERQQERFAVVGTGVVMGLASDPMRTPWLVTARHMFFELSKNWSPTELYLRFSWF